MNETTAEGSPAMVKSLLQALIHEIRVDHAASLSYAFGGRRHGGQCGSRTVPVGGGKGIRTPDLLTASQALYQLSYTPNGQTIVAVRETATG